MLEWMLSLPRYAKRFISVLADFVFLTASMLIALFATQSEPLSSLGQTLPIFLLSVPATIIAFTKLGLYRAVIRYIGQHALGAVLAGIISNALLLGMLFQLAGIADKGNLIFVYAIMALVTSGGLRLAARMVLFQRHNGHKERVLIYGAGSATKNGY